MMFLQLLIIINSVTVSNTWQIDSTDASTDSVFIIFQILHSQKQTFINFALKNEHWACKVFKTHFFQIFSS